MMQQREFEEPPGKRPPHPGSHRATVWEAVPDSMWNDWHWQLRHRLTGVADLKRVLTLSPEEEEGVARALQRLRMAITPYIASLLDPHNPNCPLRRQVVPTIHELQVGQADMADPLSEDHHSPVPGLVHRYPDRVLVLVTDQCAAYCRHCTRRRLVGAKQQVMTIEQLNRVVDYVAQHSEVRDVLISGGDPLVLNDRHIEHLLARLRAIPHIEVLRLGTRVPVFLPQRITPELVNMLRRYHPLYINIHFNHPAEVTPEVKRACALLADAGIPLGSQTVLLRRINDCPHIIKRLMQLMLSMRVRPYYLYQCDLSQGIEHFRTSVAKGIEVVENLRGHTTGLAVPQFCIDAPGGGGKVPLLPQYLISMSDTRAIVRNFEGRICAYSQPAGYRSECPQDCAYCQDVERCKSAGVAGLLGASDAVLQVAGQHAPAAVAPAGLVAPAQAGPKPGQVKDLVIANIVDAYRDSVALIQDPVLRQHEVLDSFYIEDRALLWQGERKVVVTSKPVDPQQVRYLRRVMGYTELENLSPQQPTESLCEDILREEGLRSAIVARLREAREVRLITFVASPLVLAVAESLRGSGLTVSTPECPSPAGLRVRERLDTKAGFRQFFASIQSRVPGLRLPEGAVAGDTGEAARLAVRFLSKGRGCLCKPNISQSGLGLLFLRPHELQGGPAQWQRTIRARLDANPQMTNDAIVVEELIDVDPSIGGGSPSIEMRVPADPQRDVEFMYLCGQVLGPQGYFLGVEMYRDLLSAELQRTVEAAGVAVAREMRKAGYVGVFDMDMVAGRDGRLYAVEVNARRTGGTHAHEAAEALFGPRYWERAGVISNNALAFEGPALNGEGLRELLSGLLWPMAGGRQGILPTIVSSLASNRLGYIAFAPAIEGARDLVGAMYGRLSASGRRPAGMEQVGVAQPAVELPQLQIPLAVG